MLPPTALVTVALAAPAPQAGGEHAVPAEPAAGGARTTAAEPAAGGAKATAAEPARGGAKAAPPVRLPLADVIGYARGNPGVQASRHQIEAFEARLREANRAWLPQGTATALLAPSPEVRCFDARGDRSDPDDPDPARRACVTTDASDVNQFELGGVFTRLELRLGMPLWTFGKIDGARRAAAQGVALGQAQLDIVRRDAEYDAHRAYWGLKLARELLFTIDEGEGYLDKAIDKVSRELDTGKGDATETDLLRLRVLEAELDARRLEAQKMADLALAGMAALAPGAPAGFDIDDEPLALAEQEEIRGLDFYRDLARRHRPEYRALDAGLRLREELAGIERSRLFPDLALVGFFNYAVAPGVDDPQNLFASDPFNTTSAGAGAVLSLSLDYPLKLARLDRARAEAREMRATREHARAGLDLDLYRKHADLVEARGRLDALRRGEKAAHQWLVATHQSLMAGLSDPKDLSDALLGFFTLRLRYLQAIYDVNVGWAALRQRVGE